MTNRVDELEGQVAELRAAVNGLTEELVETKARVRELENEAEPTEPTAEREEPEAEGETSGTRTQNDDHVMVVEQERNEAGHATETVEGEETVEPAEAATDTDPESEDTIADDSDTETDDIIVA